jgi:hypothetical protein
MAAQDQQQATGLGGAPKAITAGGGGQGFGMSGAEIRELEE